MNDAVFMETKLNIIQIHHDLVQLVGFIVYPAVPVPYTLLYLGVAYVEK